VHSSPGRTAESRRVGRRAFSRRQSAAVANSLTVELKTDEDGGQNDLAVSRRRRRRRCEQDIIQRHKHVLAAIDVKNVQIKIKEVKKRRKNVTKMKNVRKRNKNVTSS